MWALAGVGQDSAGKVAQGSSGAEGTFHLLLLIFYLYLVLLLLELGFCSCACLLGLLKE